MLSKSMLFIIALGILLPTMHQSSLGTMMLLPGPKLHPLWFTPWLPFLFLVNCVIMGYGVVVLESHAAASAFGRRRETAMLASLSKVAMGVALFFVAFRFVDIGIRGRLGALASWYGLEVVLELGLLVAGALILMPDARRRNPGHQVMAGLLLMVGGTVYRFNVYLIGFNPGAGWIYFPSLAEIMVSVGIVSFEWLAYQVLVKLRFLDFTQCG